MLNRDPITGRFMPKAPAVAVPATKAEKPKKKKKEDTRPLTGGQVLPFYAERKKLQGRTFVFTSAQNNTEIHKGFFSALRYYCDINNAQLVISQFVYNKNGFQNGVADSDKIYFAPELEPFFITESCEVAPGLIWCGEVNILPTVKYPLSGMEQYTGPHSCIIGHAKIALECVATPKNEQAKLMFATGAVTLRNYIQKKAGQQAEASHCYGALIVTISDSGTWHCRQIQADEQGSFQDGKTIYHPDRAMSKGSITAYNFGDLHCEKMDKEALQLALREVDYLQPENVFLHDTFDMTSRNHHNRGKPHFLAQTFYNGQTVERDLAITAEVLERIDKALWDSANIYVVESNHDLALQNWLDCPQYDFRKDPVNAALYLKLQAYMYECLANNCPIELLNYALGTVDATPECPRFSDQLPSFTFLNTDDSIILHGIEFGNHGHVGANGSRGNPKQFQKLNRDQNTGHTHSPSIYGGVYTAGVTGDLDMGYNIGPSSWMHAHIVTYGTGKRCISLHRYSETGVLESCFVGAGAPFNSET